MHKGVIPNEYVLMRCLAISLASSYPLEIPFMKDFYSQEGVSIFLKDFSQYRWFLCGTTQWQTGHTEVGTVKVLLKVLYWYYYWKYCYFSRETQHEFLSGVVSPWVSEELVPSFQQVMGDERDGLQWSHPTTNFLCIYDNFAFLWRKTSMVNVYEQKWVNFIWSVMLPKSIVRLLLPSREKKKTFVCGGMWFFLHWIHYRMYRQTLTYNRNNC